MSRFSFNIDPQKHLLLRPKVEDQKFEFLVYSAMAETPEQRELNLIGKVELRIALADTDVKLQSILQTYLPPLLLKLASESKSVRDKVLSVCQHISTRIKAPSIQLPVDALLKQYKKANNPLVRRFDLLYVQQGVDRLPVPVSPISY